jgi:hypothetical protein
LRRTVAAAAIIHDGYDRGSGNGPGRSKYTEEFMKKVLMGLAALPFLAGVAVAGQPLTDRQMDRVTAGFSATSIGDAEGLVGESGLLLTTTATLAQVSPLASRTVGEASSTIYKSLAASASSSVTSTIAPVAIPSLSP